MAISSFNGGAQSTRIIASDQGQDFKVEGFEQTKAINVAGSFFFQDDAIATFPEQSHQAFLNHWICIQTSILKQLKVMTQHLASMSDLEDMEIEPGEDSHGGL